jgi:hypothetical protein
MSLPCPNCLAEQRQFVLVKHVAQLAGMKPTSVANDVQSGKVPGAYKGPDGTTWLVPVEEAIEYVNAKRIEQARRRASIKANMHAAKPPQSETKTAPGR